MCHLPYSLCLQKCILLVPKNECFLLLLARYMPKMGPVTCSCPLPKLETFHFVDGDTTTSLWVEEEMPNPSLLNSSSPLPYIGRCRPSGLECSQILKIAKKRITLS